MSEERVRTAVLELLRPRAEQAGIPMATLGDQDLMGLGVVDSLNVMSLIAEVERATSYGFVWDRFDAEDGLTVSSLVRAFDIG